MQRLIILLVCGILLSSCNPITTVAPSVVPAMTEMPILPTATLTPGVKPEFPASPVPDTPTPEPRGDDILTNAQKERIEQVAANYLSPTQEQAMMKAEQLNYVKYASPSNMCGPLALAILRDAGLVSRYTDLHDFWLLRPDKNVDVVTRTFPSERFEHFYFSTPINEFNFSAFPLKVGDVLYLYAGLNGTFEHILTVTRVDEDGRAYSVTNLNTQPDDGYYIIEEVMLYDPNQPGVGQFYEWTDRKNLWIGMTGFGGFDIWRFSEPVQDASAVELALTEQLDSTFEQAGGNWYAIIMDPVTGYRVYDRNSDERVHVASVIKVPIAMLFFSALEQQGVTENELPAFLESHGIGRTYSQLLHAMLVDSEEDATKVLTDYLRQPGLDIPATLKAWNASQIDVFTRTAPLEEIAGLLSNLYGGEFVSQEARRILLSLMSEYTANDDTRLGVISPLLPEGGILYNKRGTLTDARLIVGDAGLLVWPSENGMQAYVIVMFGYPGEIPTTDIKLVAGIEQAARLFWEFAR